MEAEKTGVKNKEIQDSTITSQTMEIENLEETLSDTKVENNTIEEDDGGLELDYTADSTVEIKISDAKARRRERKLRFQPKNVEFEKEFSTLTEYYKKISSTGNVDIPRALVIDKEIKASKNEINAMMTAVSQNAAAKTVLQRLPRHMRRRAASHNMKRLPKRYHQLAEYLNSVKELSKAESRRKRRRKVVLQNKHAKKSKKPEWLETHLWYAKRFHMSNIADKRYENWGKYIAINANDKCFKASYRAVNSHCLIQDVSYLKCFQVTGNSKILNDLLNHISLNSQTLEFDTTEKQILMRNVTKNTVIGPVRVICGRDPIKNENIFEMWFWFHPLVLNEFKETIKYLIETKYGDVQFQDVSDNYNRFELKGPKSFATLLSVLRPFNKDYLNLSIEFENWLHSNKQIMIDELCRFNEHMVALHKQFYSHETGSNIEDGQLYNLIVNDPRLTLPRKKSKPKLTPYYIDGSSSDAITNFETVLLNQTVVDAIAETKKPDAVVSTRKHELKIKCGNVTNSNEILDTHVPVVVVFNKGFEGLKTRYLNDGSEKDVEKHGVHSGPCNGFSSGCSIILPKNWATAFWIPFVYHLSRAGGLRENQNVKLQCLKPHFPQDYPDTETGKTWWNNLQNENSKVYYKKPPAKRCNYTVLGTASPFKPNWNIVFKNESRLSSDAQKFAKLDASGVLLMSNEQCTQKRPIDGDKSEEPEAKKIKIDKNTEQTVKLFPEYEFSILRCKDSLEEISTRINDLFTGNNKENIGDLVIKYKDCLIPVRLLSLSKGVPFTNAIICAPKEEDLKEINECFTNPYKNGLRSLDGPKEPPHWKQSRAEFKKQKKETKNKKREKNKAQPLNFDVQPCRNTIGFLTTADYLFTYACGGGVGFVSLSSFLKAVKYQCSNAGITEILTHPKSRSILIDKSSFSSVLFVLYKNTDTAQYRFAKLEIIK